MDWKRKADQQTKKYQLTMVDAAVLPLSPFDKDGCHNRPQQHSL